jgi:hypothetical protein
MLIHLPLVYLSYSIWLDFACQANYYIRMNMMTDEEYLKVLQQMDRMPSIFHKLWEMGRPMFTNDPGMSTACVTFDDSGSLLEFIINEDFWQTLDINQKIFVVSHECLHIFFNHGKRFFQNKDLDAMKANIATDLVVNHILVDSFNFSRKNIDPHDVYCWVDKFFSEEENAYNKSAEWYYKNLDKDKMESMGCTTVDMHSNSNEYHEKIEEYLNNNFSEEEIEVIGKIKELDENSGGGNIAGKLSSIVNVFNASDQKVKKKKKWESVIKNWALKTIKQTTKSETQWAHLNRRFSLLPKELILPSEYEYEDDFKEKDKINVWFFLDTSGSCAGYAQRFFNAANTLPEKHFEINLYCFDTRVFPTTLKSGKLYGFGGTSFRILENYIQRSLTKQKKEYPKAVFVITDGWGDKIRPERPENWYWFMTPRNTTMYIPKKSNVYNLKDFE